RCFFFQAEDGIRYFHVTGVQTCALPIYIIINHLRFLHTLKIQKNMTLEEIKTVLPTLDNVEFQLANGTFVPEHFHVTEIGQITKIGRASCRQRVKMSVAVLALSRT